MLKVENVEVWGFEHAIRGMRNPMNSWSKSDSYKTHIEDAETLETADYQFFLGEKDLELMQKLCKAGPEHRKFMRQIFISLDITAPFYWWKEFDTYKVGTVANSCSTMHKLTAKPFELSDFSTEHLNYKSVFVLEDLIKYLNVVRFGYNQTKDKDTWWQLVQLLPSSYNQKRTITMNYENALTIIKQRIGHKLDEWTTLIEKLLELPYLKEIAEL
ncbi:MAG: hypothetical protein J6W84_06375 [Bacteroidales bacterium]|nr:hypothetical protein [Bacteroidales bacterium]